MGFNRDNYARIRGEYENKYKLAQSAAELRRAEVHTKIDGLAQIDSRLSAVGMRIMNEALNAGGDYAERIAAIRAENRSLQEKRRALLEAAGYPADYTDVRYECEKCGDSGFADGVMCDCMRRELVLAGYESSGIAKLMREQTFASFSLDYYRGNAEAYERMSKIYAEMKRYAEGFHGVSSGNIMLVGGTGLGKTHLSSAAARVIIERGYDVLYVSALNMISDFEFRRFGSSASSEHEPTDRYFDCDLLIIDDLGSEMINNFTVSVIYNIVNTRLNTAKPVLVSTNLDAKELRQKYWDRLTSRFFGEYQVMQFKGVDVRQQKIRNKNV